MIPFAVTVLNRYDLLRKMLASLEAGTMVPSRILILDNGQLILRHMREKGPLPLGRLTRESIALEPRSVSRSWNEAIHWAHGAVVIANDDVEFAPDAFEKLVLGLRWGEADFATTENVGGFVTFAMTPELIAKVGVFDERFVPAYFEDEDYRYRMKLAGLVPRSVPGCRIEHLESGSLRAMNDSEKEVLKSHYLGNATLYQQKWGGGVGKETLTSPSM